MSIGFMEAGNAWCQGAVVLAVAAENPLERFGVNWYDFLSQAIAFLIIAWILNRFVFKPVMKSVAARQRDMEETAANNERIRQELKATEEARQEVLLRAQEHAEHLISETKAQVAELLEQQKRRSEALGVELLAKARADALLEQARLKTELKTEIAAMIVTLTAKLMQTNLGEADRSRLLQAAIQDIAASAGA